LDFSLVGHEMGPSANIFEKGRPQFKQRTVAKKQTREKEKVNILFLANPQGVLAIGKQIIDPQKLFGKFNPEVAFLPGTL
jgi:hypothetical protein